MNSLEYISPAYSVGVGDRGDLAGLCAPRAVEVARFRDWPDAGLTNALVDEELRWLVFARFVGGCSWVLDRSAVRFCSDPAAQPFV